MGTIANIGKRRKCRCIKTMNIVIGGQLQIYYKIYGDEFDLSCTKDEFDENFILIDKKK